jgi:hypothetical protein
MTSQLLISANPAGTVSVPATPEELVGMNETATKAKTPNQPATLSKMPYQADQQMKFLHLQAETDALLEQLRLIKQQREAASTALSGR